MMDRKECSYLVKYRLPGVQAVCQRSFKSRQASKEFYDSLKNAEQKYYVFIEETLIDFEKNTNEFEEIKYVN